MTKEGRSRIGRKGAALAAVACAVAVACAAVAVWRPWHSNLEEGGADASASGVSAVREYDSDETPLLSGWSGFGDAWEECSEGEAAYAEEGPGGETLFYRMGDGYAEGPGLDGSAPAVLSGASEVGADGGWNLVLVDCSTGEATWWLLSEEVSAQLEQLGSSEEGPVAAGDLLSFGQGWALYFDEPAPEGSRVVEDFLTAEIPMEEWVSLCVEIFGRYESERDDIVALAAKAESTGSGELMDALVERYGAAEVEKYAPEAAAEAAGGE